MEMIGKFFGEEDVISLILNDDLGQKIKSAVNLAAKISRCSRICFIAKEGTDFLIKGGIPEKDHGIGQQVKQDRINNLLGQILKEKKMVYVSHPAADQRTSCIKELTETYRIESILYAPLYYKKSDGKIFDIGILVADAVTGDKKISSEELGRFKEFAKFTAMIIGKELEHRENFEMMKKMENLFALGKHTAGIAHITRNRLGIIGGFAQHLLEMTGNKTSSEINEKLFSRVRNELQIIYKESLILEKVVKDILIFSHIAERIVPSGNNLNEVIREEIKTFKPEKSVDFIPELDKTIDKIKILFDRDYMKIVIQDIIKNAVEAEAKRVLIKTKLDAEAGTVKVVIGNDGKVIKEEDIENIFSPFFTTKSNGTGLGLANTYAIVTAPAHGGEIIAKSKEAGQGGNMGSCQSPFLTQFEITLPLKNKKGSNNPA